MPSHITLPAPGGAGAVRAARRALAKAGIEPDEVDHISAHATSTPEGDAAELAAFRSLLGEHAPAVSITATKGAIGHTLGAAGGIGAVATVMAMREGRVPPTLNLVAPDEAVGELDLHAARRPRSAGPGGHRQCLRLRWPEHARSCSDAGRPEASGRAAAPDPRAAGPDPRAAGGTTRRRS